MAKYTVYHTDLNKYTVNRFKELGASEDRTRSGIPSTARPKRSERQMAKNNNKNNETFLIKNALQLKRLLTVRVAVGFLQILSRFSEFLPGF